MNIKFQPTKIGEKRTARYWTTGEHKYLKYNYGTLSAIEIAEHLQRPVGSIYVKAQKLGLANLQKNGRAAKIVYDRVKIKHMILNLGFGARKVSEAVGCNIRHVHWIVENEFDNTVKKKLIQNGKEDQRELRNRSE